MADETPGKIITILLVDDMADISANVKKLLSFEADFEVVGMASTGAEGLTLAQKLRPDIIIIDINMPDVDGLQITTQIVNRLPDTGVIIMSAQDDARYMRMAMTAGAKAFLTKPSTPDEIYHAVRAVHARAPVIKTPAGGLAHPRATETTGKVLRAGRIIVVYSPQGGAGCTTLATNLATALNRENSHALLVDGNLQFGDVRVFLNLDARSSLLDLVEDVDDLDTEYFENVAATHASGLKVLLGPGRPELAEKVSADPTALARILDKVRVSYDFIVVDTSLHLDDMLLSLMDIADLILLVSAPTLQSVKNIRFVLDLFDQMNYLPGKTMLIFNRVPVDAQVRRIAITPDKAHAFLKHPIAGMIPESTYLMQDAVRKGIPAVTLKRDRDKSPVKELLDLADAIFVMLMPVAAEETAAFKGKTIDPKNESGKRVARES